MDFGQREGRYGRCGVSMRKRRRERKRKRTRGIMDQEERKRKRESRSVRALVLLIGGVLFFDDKSRGLTLACYFFPGGGAVYTGRSLSVCPRTVICPI